MERRGTAVVFDGSQMSAEADSLASALGARTPVFVLIAAPESDDYVDVLKTELDQLQAKFSFEPELRTRQSRCTG